MSAVIVSSVLTLVAGGQASGQEVPQPDLKAIISNLASPEAAVRTSATRALAAMPADQLAKPLIEALSDESWEVRASATKMLVDISRTKEATDQLVKLLKDPVWAVRNEAAKALGATHDAKVLDALKEAMKADDPLVRPAVVAAIFNLGAKIDAEFVKSCLADKQVEVRNAAITWVNRASIDSSYLPLCIDMVQSEDVTVRAQALGMLLRVAGAKEATPQVIKLLKDPEWSIRKGAAEALGAIGDPKALDALKEAMKADDLQVRPAVAAAIFKVCPKIDAPFFKSCVNDKQAEVHKEAFAWANPVLMDEQFVAVLIQMLYSGDRERAAVAAWSLGALGDAIAGNAIAEATTRPGISTELKANLADILVRCKGRTTANSQTIVPLLQDKDERTRMWACMALAGLGDPQTVEALIRFAQSQDEPIARRAAIYAIGRTGNQSAVDALVGLVSKEGYSTKTPQGAPCNSKGYLIDPKKYYNLKQDDAAAQAICSLGVIGGEKANAAVLSALDDARPLVRSQALVMLAEAGNTCGINKSIEWMTCREFCLNSAAVEACHYYDDPRLTEALIEFIKSDRHADTTDLFEGRPAREDMFQSPKAGGGGSIYNSEMSLRCEAMEVLLQRWPGKAKAVLLECLKDPQPQIVHGAMKLLGQVPDKEDAAAFLEVMHKLDLRYLTQAVAGEALCKLKVKEAFDPAMTLLQTRHHVDSTDTTLKLEALAKAAGAMAKENFLEQLKDELKSPTGRHAAALWVLEYADSPELAPDCLPFLEDRDWGVRRQAVMTLGKM
jgi:HEAT repeat protein